MRLTWMSTDARQRCEYILAENGSIRLRDLFAGLMSKELLRLKREDK